MYGVARAQAAHLSVVYAHRRIGVGIRLEFPVHLHRVRGLGITLRKFADARLALDGLDCLVVVHYPHVVVETHYGVADVCVQEGLHICLRVEIFIYQSLAADPAAVPEVRAHSVVVGAEALPQALLEGAEHCRVNIIVECAEGVAEQLPLHSQVGEIEIAARCVAGAWNLLRAVALRQH